jgi:uncharacterized protein (UPF0332 family)
VSDAVEHLAMAKQHLGEAYKLLEHGDPYDACEKVWASIKHSTIALTMAVLKEAAPLKKVSWRSFIKEVFMRTGLSEEEASEWASYFIDVRKGLHGDCFYGLIYEEEEHRPLMERAREYIDLVHKILKKLGYQHSNKL